MRVAFIGCGKIAEYHMAALALIGKSFDLHLYDINEHAAINLSKAWPFNCNIHSGYESMINNIKPDIVHILTPPGEHFKLARTALESGSHVIVEKPFMSNYEEAVEIIDFANSKDRIICVDFSLLFMPATLRALNAINGGELGRLLSFYCFYGHDEKGKLPYGGPTHWSYKVSEGLIRNLITHPLSLLIYLLGEPEEVETHFIARNLLPQGLHDLLHVMIQSVNGIGNIAVSMCHGNSSRICVIQCEGGIIHIDFTNQICSIVVNKSKNPIMKIVSPVKLGKQYIGGTIMNVLSIVSGKLKRNPGLIRCVTEFYQSIVHELPSPVSYETILNVQKTEDLIFNHIQ